MRTPESRQQVLRFARESGGRGVVGVPVLEALMHEAAIEPPALRQANVPRL
jgi:hypothetical protein